MAEYYRLALGESMLSHALRMSNVYNDNTMRAA